MFGKAAVADWAAPAPCPSGRAVKVVTGRAKPDAVIHRNRNNNAACDPLTSKEIFSAPVKSNTLPSCLLLVAVYEETPLPYALFLH